MPTIGVDYGGQANLFNVGQSAGQSLGSLFSGATELKRATAEANINRVNARTQLDQQEYGFRDKVYNSGRDAYLYSHGSSNADPSGANPVPVTPYHRAQGEFQGATYALGTGASDIAGARNRFDGSELVQSTDPAKQRSGMVLLGGNPTRNTVLGPNDNIGTNAEIEINKADVPNKIAIEQAKTAAEQNTLGPYAGGPFGKTNVFENTISILEPKIKSGTATTEEIRDYNIAKGKIDPNVTHDVTLPDGTHIYPSLPGGKLPQDISVSPYAAPTPPPGPPAPIPPPEPGVGGATPRSTAPKTATPAPAVVIPPGAPAPSAPPAPQNTVNGLPVFGVPKPITATDNEVKMDLTVAQTVDAEKKLSQLTPDQVGDFFAAVTAMNPDAKYTSQQFLQQFSTPQQREFARTAMMFVEPILRLKSGAALSSSEWAGAFMQFVPPPGATQRDIDSTRANRMSVLRAIVNSVYSRQPDRLNQINQELKANGIDLNFSGSTAPPATAAPRKKPTITGVEEIFD